MKDWTAHYSGLKEHAFHCRRNRDQQKHQIVNLRGRPTAALGTSTSKSIGLVQQQKRKMNIVDIAVVPALPMTAHAGRFRYELQNKSSLRTKGDNDSLIKALKDGTIVLFVPGTLLGRKQRVLNSVMPMPVSLTYRLCRQPGIAFAGGCKGGMCSLKKVTSGPAHRAGLRPARIDNETKS